MQVAIPAPFYHAPHVHPYHALMVTLLVLLIFSGFFLLYNTSKKAELHRNFFLECWAQDHLQASKIIGIFILLGSLAICTSYFGTGSGIFGFFVILMTVAGSVVILAPLRYIKAWTLSSLSLISILLELIWK